MRCTPFVCGLLSVSAGGASWTWLDSSFTVGSPTAWVSETAIEPGGFAGPLKGLWTHPELRLAAEPPQLAAWEAGLPMLGVQLPLQAPASRLPPWTQAPVQAHQPELQVAVAVAVAVAAPLAASPPLLAAGSAAPAPAPASAGSQCPCVTAQRCWALQLARGATVGEEWQAQCARLGDAPAASALAWRLRRRLGPWRSVFERWKERLDEATPR